MSTTGARPEKAHQKHSWILLFASSALMALSALYVLTVEASMLGGLGMLGFGVFGMAIARFSYRKGERWAWYTLWYVPICAAAGEAVDLVYTGMTNGLFVIVILSASGLLLPYRTFFPRET